MARRPTQGFPKPQPKREGPPNPAPRQVASAGPPSPPHEDCQESRGPQENTDALGKGAQVSKAYGQAQVPAGPGGRGPTVGEEGGQPRPKKARPAGAPVPRSHPRSHLILEPWRSQGQGQETLWMLRFAKGPRAASLSCKDPGRHSIAIPQVPKPLGHSAEEDRRRTCQIEISRTAAIKGWQPCSSPAWSQIRARTCPRGVGQARM